MKTIIVHIDSDEGQDARLQAAFDLARAFDGHVHCLQVTPYAAYAMGDASIGAFPVTALIETVEASRAAEKAAVEAQLAKEDISWDFVGRDGDPAERLIEAARLADVIVMSAGPFVRNPTLPLGLTGDVALHARTPVLAVPAASRGFAVASAALIAWDGSREAATALRAALPLLHLAGAVFILTVAEKPSDFPARAAAVFLSRHGITAEVIERPDDGQGVEAAIRAVAIERGAGWIVQGAYGHSRLRETLFGGVTRGLLGDAPLPLFIAH